MRRMSTLQGFAQPRGRGQGKAGLLIFPVSLLFHVAEFQEARNWVSKRLLFQKDVDVNLFEEYHPESQGSL